MQSFFIIGTERSGTNLLRVVLNAHPEIVIPHPPHIFKNFHRLLPRYGDLSQENNLRKLVQDVVTLVRLHPYPWEIQLSVDAIMREVTSPTLMNVLFVIYQQYARGMQKDCWGCKSTFMIEHVAEILKHDPHAKFIYLVRDGRDVAVSAKNSIFNHYHPYYVAWLWKKEQQLGIQWLKDLDQEQIFFLKYEDLLQDFDQKAKDLCRFLNKPFREEMLQYYKGQEAMISGQLSESWKNTAQPVFPENRGKYISELSKKDIALFEVIAKEELAYFDYPLMTEKENTDSRKQGHWRIEYWLKEVFFFLKAQIRAFLKDKNNARRYAKYFFIKSRRLCRGI